MTEMAVPAADSLQERMSPEGRRALFGAWFGFVVDMFDVYLPIAALAPATEYFQPKSLSPGAAAIIEAAIFTATLIGRPIGAMIFDGGELPDVPHPSTAGTDRTVGAMT